MADKYRLHFGLPKLVPKYHEHLRKVARIDRLQIDYFKDKDFDVLQKSIEWMSRDLLDEMLGKIEFGKDYVIRGETRQEQDLPRDQIIIRQDMLIDELVKCKDCTHFVGERNEGFCALGMLGHDLICVSDYCSYGERREEG